MHVILYCWLTLNVAKLLTALILPMQSVEHCQNKKINRPISQSDQRVVHSTEVPGVTGIDGSLLSDGHSLAGAEWWLFFQLWWHERSDCILILQFLCHEL
jgi:hypothetical protein